MSHPIGPFCCIFGSCWPPFRNPRDNHKAPFTRVAGRSTRSCTDLIWLLVFLCFIIGSVYIDFLASRLGDPLALIYGLDSFGNRCGMNNTKFYMTSNGKVMGHFPMSGENLADKRYLFPMDVRHPGQSVWICVNSCPGDWHRTVETAEGLFMIQDLVSLCDYEYQFSGGAFLNVKSSNVGPCPVLPIYPSRSTLNRCLPARFSDLPVRSIPWLTSFIRSEDFLRQTFSDIYRNVEIYLVVILISLTVSLSISLILIWINEHVVYTFFIYMLPFGLFISIALFVVSGFQFVWSLSFESKYLEIDPTAERFLNGTRVDMAIVLSMAFLVAFFTVTAWIIAWTLFKPRKQIISELFVQMGKPLRRLPFLLIGTLLNCLFSVILFYNWTKVLFALLSIYEPEVTFLHAINHEEGQPLAIPFVQNHRPAWANYLLVYHIFMLIWLKAFSSDVQKHIISVATSFWYFGFDSTSRGIFVRSVYLTLRYHLGTIAFGSLLFALIRIPSRIYLFFYYRFLDSQKYSKNDNNFPPRFFWILSRIERTLRYLNSHAYAVTAANGEDFCSASKTATNLWMDNSWVMLTTNTVARILFMMTRSAFSIIIGFFCALYFRVDAETEYWILPTLICVFLSYFIMNRFLTLEETIIETLFLCYASEIDGLDLMHPVASGRSADRTVLITKIRNKQDYGFNFFIARRLQLEQKMNNSIVSGQNAGPYAIPDNWPSAIEIPATSDIFSFGL